MKRRRGKLLVLIGVIFTVGLYCLLGGSFPTCKAGDPGIYVGGMLVGGCPRTDANGNLVVPR